MAGQNFTEFPECRVLGHLFESLTRPAESIRADPSDLRSLQLVNSQRSLWVNFLSPVATSWNSTVDIFKKQNQDVWRIISDSCREGLSHYFGPHFAGNQFMPCSLFATQLALHLDVHPRNRQWLGMYDLPIYIYIYTYIHIRHVTIHIMW